MAKDIFSETFKKCCDFAKECPQILIGFSGGKESCCIADLAVRAGFQNIVPFYLYTIPGLGVIDRQLEWAMKFWGFPQIHQYPAGIMHNAFKFGWYRPSHQAFDKMPAFGPSDVHKLIRQDFGISTIMLGIRAADSITRRRMAARGIQQRAYFHPLEKWTKWDVLAYLKIRNIPLPPSAGGATSDIGLDYRAALWLHREYPDDFEKMAKVFTYYRAIVTRKLLYDIPTDKELGWDQDRQSAKAHAKGLKRKATNNEKEIERNIIGVARAGSDEA